MNGQQTFKDSILNIFLSLVPVYIIAELLLNYYCYYYTITIIVIIIIIITIITIIITIIIIIMTVYNF